MIPSSSISVCSTELDIPSQNCFEPEVVELESTLIKASKIDVKKL